MGVDLPPDREMPRPAPAGRDGGDNGGGLLGGKHDAHPGGDPATPFHPRPRQRGVSDEALQPAELLEPFGSRAADVNRRVADDEVLLITLGTMEHE